jgi:hypothetical protein
MLLPMLVHANGSRGWCNWLVHVVGSHGQFKCFNDVVELVRVIGRFCGWFNRLVQLVGACGWFNWLVHVVAPH